MAGRVTYQKQCVDPCSLGFSNIGLSVDQKEGTRWKRAVAVLGTVMEERGPLSSCYHL